MIVEKNLIFVFIECSVTKKGDIKPPFFENKISLGLLEF